MELEEKHLKWYLGTGVQIKHKNSGIYRLSIDQDNSEFISVKTVLETTGCKLVLKAISALKHKSSSELKAEYGINDDIIFWVQELTNTNTDIKYLTVEAYTFLLDYHFDIFDFNKKGLAIT